MRKVPLSFSSNICLRNPQQCWHRSQLQKRKWNVKVMERDAVLLAEQMPPVVFVLHWPGGVMFFPFFYKLFEGFLTCVCVRKMWVTNKWWTKNLSYERLAVLQVEGAYMKVTPQPKVTAKGLVIFAQILDRNIKKQIWHQFLKMFSCNHLFSYI